MANNTLLESKPILITLAIVLLAIVGVAGYFIYVMRPAPVTSEAVRIPDAKPAPPTIEEVPKPVEEPIAARGAAQEDAPTEQESAFVLPRLDDSDQLVRDGVVSLTRHEGINAWLASSELIRKFVVFVDNIARGQVAKEAVRPLAPRGAFLVKKLDDKTFELDPASYDRYNLFTEIAVSVDARRAVDFYRLLRPLAQRAYAELGYQDRPFDDVIFLAIGRLLETPAIDEPVRLVRPVVMYRFEDERMEKLNAAQKQMIRMGPENTRRLQMKIREVALELRAALRHE